MKLDPVAILLNKNFIPNKKFYFIGGNETTLMEKTYAIIVEKFQKKEKVVVEHIDTIEGFVGGDNLFENKKIYYSKNCKGINKLNLEKIRNTNDVFIFVQENSQKTKNIKNIFAKDEELYLIDCYELNRDSKIKILNEFLKSNKIDLEKDIYWLLIEKLENKYIFFENTLNKIISLGQADINLKNIRKLLTNDSSGKEKVFFYLNRKNHEITDVYREKITSTSDVADLYYYCRYFCQLIIDFNNELDYVKKIPVYLFKEKKYLIDIYRKFDEKKKKRLLRLLHSTERILRNESHLSLIIGLRFLLNIKRITIS